MEVCSEYLMLKLITINLKNKNVMRGTKIQMNAVVKLVGMWNTVEIQKY